MKTKLPLLTLLTLLTAVSVNAQIQTPAGTWLRYTVKGEEFSVTLPIEPGMKTSEVFNVRLQKGRVERVVEARVSDLVYRIYIYENKEYSLQVDDKPQIEQFFATNEYLYRFAAQGATSDHPGVKQFFGSVMLGPKHEGVALSDGPGLPLETKPAGETVYSGRDVDKKAKLQSYPPPEQPDTGKSKPITGTVILKVVFTADGRVTNIQVVKGLPNGITDRAIEAAKKIKFIPATKDGKFVSMWMQLEYNFNLY